MTAQWLRQCQLVVGDNSGAGIDLSNLHIKFAIFQGTTQSPHRAEIRVYNLSDATSKQIQLESTKVQLQAGYEDKIGLIFAGDLIQKRDGRENATDTFLDLLAADGDTAYNRSVINATLAAGASPTDIHASILKALSPFGVQPGYAPWTASPGGSNVVQSDVDATQANVNALNQQITDTSSQARALALQGTTARNNAAAARAAGNTALAAQYDQQANTLFAQSQGLLSTISNTLDPQYQSALNNLQKLQDASAAGSTRLPRGKVMYGMTKNYVRELSESTNTQWHFSSGQLNMVPVDGVLEGPAVVLTANTGLIGLPTQTLDGIIVRCLLNSDIKVGRLLKLDNASIQAAQFSADFKALNEQLPSISRDGFYKALAVNHNGDTRGPNWYTEIICSSLDGTQPTTAATLNVVP